MKQSTWYIYTGFYSTWIWRKVNGEIVDERRFDYPEEALSAIAAKQKAAKP